MAEALTSDDDAAERELIISARAEARILIEAGPGTGKTEIAARKLAVFMHNGVRPSEVLVLSFSRSAVKTLTSRLANIENASGSALEELRHLSIRTFDSWAFRQLCLLGYPANQLLSRKHDHNIECLTTLIAGNRREEVRARIGKRRHLIIDEFQDLPGVRGNLVLALLDLLCPLDDIKCGFTILGDPAQSIYGFSARQDQKKSFPSPMEYWRRIVDCYGAEVYQYQLRRNYRSTEAISKLSEKLRAILLGERSESEKLALMRKVFSELPEHECEIGPDWLLQDRKGTHAILTRTNGEALRVLQHLVGKDVDGPSKTVRLKAGSFATLSPPWIGALLRKVKDTEVSRSQFGRIYDLLSKQWTQEQKHKLGLPVEEIAWQRLIRASGGSIRATSIELAILRNRLAWHDAFPDDQFVTDKGVFVTTVHQSKGMEFEAVTVLDMTNVEDGETADETQERASVGYVALTRAENLVRKLDPNTLRSRLTQKEFPSGRARHRSFWNGWMNLAMGLEGDIDPFGFVDPLLLGGHRGVSDLQAFLLEHSANIDGHKVILKRHYDEVTTNVCWHIHLQDGNKTGRLVGRTAGQLTRDIFYTTKKQGYMFPFYIYNLRIGGVGTVTSDLEFPLIEPESRSRIWLGLSIFGTGDFKMKKYSS